MSEENVAIVKSSWAGWRQGLHEQWVRDFHDGVEERVTEWSEAEGRPDLQPEDFIDADDAVLVRARVVGREQPVWFRYTMAGRMIVGWDVYEKEAKARKAAGL